jgi:hypothetical protein
MLLLQLLLLLLLLLLLFVLLCSHLPFYSPMASHDMPASTSC